MTIKNIFAITIFLSLKLFSFSQTNPISQGTSKCKIIHDTIVNREYYMFTETLPKYPGGNELMLAYIKNNLKVPSKCFEGCNSVYLAYIVEANGKLTYVRTLRSSDQELSKELIKVISTLQKFSPATCDKKPVPCYFIIPFHITLK